MRLFDEAQRRGSEMAALAELGREVGGLLDLHAVIRRIGERAKDLLQADTSAVFLEEGPGADRYLPLVALGNLAEPIMGDSIAIGEGVIGDLASRGAAEVVNDLMHDPRSVHIPGSEDDVEERLMAAPLLARGRVIGMMAVWRTESDALLFTEEDLNFLVGLSQQAAIAIETARLFQEIGRQKQYFESLVDISPVAVVTMDRDEVVSGWNPAAERLFGYSAQDAIGATIDSLVIKSSEYADEGQAIVREALEQGRAHRLTRRMRADGKFVEVEIDIVPLVVDGDHQGYYAIYHDVTELQEARRSADAANEAEERVPGDDEPRDPHPDERDHRHERAAARHGPERRAAGVRHDGLVERRGAPGDHQRHPGLLEDRGRQDGPRAGPVRRPRPASSRPSSWSARPRRRKASRSRTGSSRVRRRWRSGTSAGCARSC